MQCAAVSTVLGAMSVPVQYSSLPKTIATTAGSPLATVPPTMALRDCAWLASSEGEHAANITKHKGSSRCVTSPRDHSSGVHVEPSRWGCCDPDRLVTSAAP